MDIKSENERRLLVLVGCWVLGVGRWVFTFGGFYYCLLHIQDRASIFKFPWQQQMCRLW